MIITLVAVAALIDSADLILSFLPELFIIFIIISIFGIPVAYRLVNESRRKRLTSRNDNRPRRTVNRTGGYPPRMNSYLKSGVQRQKNTAAALMRLKCPVCGYPSEKGSLFCKKCGARLKKSTPLTAEITCMKCGSQVKINSKVCEKCGKEIEICEICKKAINPGDVVSECKYCNRLFHHSHLRETVKVFGECPICRCKLHDDDLNVKILKRED
ncbi:MAG: zinc ribbon domain-containing protein [Candidatus Hodarchaeales archaeon]